MSQMVTHLIVGLSKDGAETMLYQILKYSSNNDKEIQVISLGEGNYYVPLIQKLGIRVFELSMRKHPIAAVFRLGKLLKHTDILCCWMYHANFLGAFIGKLVGVKKIIWNVRHSDLNPRYNKRSTLLINRICAKLSRGINSIAYNGEKARKVHENVGYCKTKGIVLENGVDCREYCPDRTASDAIRKELLLPDELRIILSVTRDDPIKDLPTFIEAFAKLHKIMPNTVAIMCGRGITPENHQLISACQKEQLIPGKDIYLLGMRNDIPRMMAGCDLYALHSAGEAFPNTLIQAMACGCVCVATDVGDVRRILDDERWIIPAHESGRMCSAMEKALTLSKEEQASISIKNRRVIERCYSIKEAVVKYEELYKL